MLETLDKENLEELLYIVEDAQARLRNVQNAAEQCLAPSLLNDLEHVANTLEAIKVDIDEIMLGKLLEETNALPRPRLPR